MDVQSYEVGEVVGGKLSTFTQLLASLRSQILKSGGNFFLTQENKKGEELRGMKEGRGARLLSTSWLKLRFSKHPDVRQEHL